MVDCNWGFDDIDDALGLAETVKKLATHPEVVVLRMMSLVDDVESISFKDERERRH